MTTINLNPKMRVLSAGTTYFKIRNHSITIEVFPILYLDAGNLFIASSNYKSNSFTPNIIQS